VTSRRRDVIVTSAMSRARLTDRWTTPLARHTAATASRLAAAAAADGLVTARKGVTTR